MKTILKTIACSLLIAGSVNAQSIIDEANITSVREYKLNNEEIITVKTISKEVRELKLDPNDAGQLNQTLIDAPVYVEKTIMIDNDNDARYDKEVQMTYQRDIKNSLNYITTADGVYITSSDNTPLFITEAGAYELDAEKVDNITIVVENLNTIK